MAIIRNYASAINILKETSAAFKPPTRLSVSDAAKKSLYLNQSGGYVGYWDKSKTPYMIEPMDTLASREYESVCFVGPARSGKTSALLEGWAAYTITCDPGDTLIVHMTKMTSEIYSKKVFSPIIWESPDLNDALSRRRSDDNIGFKRFKNGMSIVIAHTSPNMLAGLGYRNVAITDYDRMDDSNGEGSIYEQSKKRTQNSLSRGMCMVESSPGRDLLDPNWTRLTPHEAPPVIGISSIYNRSDRRRLYWECRHCLEYFEAKPGLELFTLVPAYDELAESIRKINLSKFAKHAAKISCPNCGGIIEHDYKNQMNKSALWVSEGQKIINGKIEGDRLKSNIAGFWLGGVSAKFQTWESLITAYLQGVREYVMTGDEETLKSKINVDFGDVYIPRNVIEAKDTSSIVDRLEDFERYTVPEWTRILVASVDVQGGRNSRFVVKINAIGEGMRQLCVDRFDIAFAEEGQYKRRINTGSNTSDWDLLLSRTVNASYKTQDGKKLLIYMVAIDTGGEGGTTDMAYQFYRRCRKLGIANKVMLIKGQSNKQKNPIIQTNGRDERGKKMMDVPINLIDTAYFKDILFSALRKREYDGNIFFHYPKWYLTEHLNELKAEIKDESGKYNKTAARNEEIDLCVYILAICWKLRLNSENFKWDYPWCSPLNTNINLVSVDFAKKEREPPKPKDRKPNIFASDEWLSALR